MGRASDSADKAAKKTFRIFGNVQKFGKSFSLAPACRWRSYSSTGNVASTSSATRQVSNPVTSPAIRHVSRHVIKHASSSVTSPAIRHVSRHVIKHASSSVTSPAIKYVSRHVIKHVSRHVIKHVSRLRPDTCPVRNQLSDRTCDLTRGQKALCETLREALRWLVNFVEPLVLRPVSATLRKG